MSSIYIHIHIHTITVSLISEKQRKFGLKVADVFRLFLNMFHYCSLVNKLNWGKLWTICLFYMVFFQEHYRKRCKSLKFSRVSFWTSGRIKFFFIILLLKFFKNSSGESEELGYKLVWPFVNCTFFSVLFTMLWNKK